MRKLFLLLLATGSIISCSKNEPIVDPIGSTDEPDKLTVYLQGPDNWFNQKGASTGKGNPQNEYKTGPYNVELYNGTERVAYVQGAYTDGAAPEFDADSGIVSGTTYEVRVSPQLNNGTDGAGNHYLYNMWDTGFNLEGKLNLTFGGQEQAENVTITPSNISQLSVTGNPYKVTFKQYLWSVQNSSWYYQGDAQYFNVPDVVFTGTNVTDRSIYWNIEGIPDVTFFTGNTGQQERYTTVPSSYTKYPGLMIKVIIQPQETSTDTYSYWVNKAKDIFTNTTGLPGFDSANHILNNAAANNNYVINFDVEELAADLLTSGIATDVDDLANATATTIEDGGITVTATPDTFADVTFPNTPNSNGAKTIWNPDNFAGVQGGSCQGSTAATINAKENVIDFTYDDDDDTITFTADGHELTYKASENKVYVTGYTGAMNFDQLVTNTRVSYFGVLTKDNVNYIFTLHVRMKASDMPADDWTWSCP